MSKNISTILLVLWLAIAITLTGCKQDKESSQGTDIEKMENNNSSDSNLQALINNATDGQIITIPNGNYDERIFISKSIKLEGESTEGVVLSVGHNNSVISIENVQGVTLRNFTIKGDEERFKFRYGIQIVKSTATIENINCSKSRIAAIKISDSDINISKCTFEDGLGEGVYADFSKLTISDSQMKNNRISGIRLESKLFPEDYNNTEMKYMISECLITENGYDGIYVGGQSSGIIEKCTIIDNHRNGILVSQAKGRNDISSNSILSSGTNGISYNSQLRSEKESSVIESNKIRNSKKYGISIIGHDIDVKVNSNDISCCDYSGIYVEQLTGIQISDNICSENYQGICIHTRAKGFSINNNQCNNNKRNGIYFDLGMAEITNNGCVGNFYNGISLSNCKADVIGNNCLSNKGSGLYLDAYVDGVVKNNGLLQNRNYGIYGGNDFILAKIEQNQCEENVKGQYRECSDEFNFVLCLFRDEQFEQLEQIISQSRATGEYFSKYGKQKYRIILESLSEYWEQTDLEYYYDWVVDKCEKWKKQYPQSVYPFVVQAGVSLDVAWDKRGRGLADEIVDYKAFQEWLAKTTTIIEQALRLEQKCPHIYSSMIITQMAMDNDSDGRSAFEEGIKIDKYYTQLYLNYTECILPKWGGSTDKVVAFAEEAADLTKDRFGDIFYSRIAVYAKNNTLRDFDDFKFDYAKIKSGFEQIIDDPRFSQSFFFLNHFCLFSCLNNDIETAKRLFERIGSNINYNVWGNQETWNYHRNWALNL
ncbi:MAG: right-handed parallel beta-helix repeat-containing protein [Sedimentisphaeraceae bacterium JB056]